MRILKQPTKIWRRNHNARNFPNLRCPNPDNCHPCGLTIDDIGAGFCSGLLVDKEDLDIINLCVFAHNYNGKLTFNTHSMSPDESMFVIRALSVANSKAFYLTESYLEVKRKSHKLHYQRRYRYIRRKTGVEFRIEEEGVVGKPK